MTDKIRFVDLRAQHEEIAPEVFAGFERVFESTAFTGGDDVRAFEQEFASYCSADHCVGVANGTDALELVLRALGVGLGDEVVLPTNTFVATAEAVALTGARPVLVDCDPVYHLIDVDQVAAARSDRTRAIVPVHLFGQMAPMERLRDLAIDGVAIVEDAAQAQGARQGGRPIASRSIAAATSFYPGKNLGAYGDGGAIITSRAELAEGVRAIANHGGLRRYEHAVLGRNSRLDTLQAVVLRAKLSRLDTWNARRRELAERYTNLLADVPGIRLPATATGNEHVWHLYVVRVQERDRVLAHLQNAGVEAGIHYPTPVHLTGAFAHLGHRMGEFPVAEAAAATMLSLPLSPHLTEMQQDRVVALLREVLR